MRLLTRALLSALACSVLSVAATACDDGEPPLAVDATTDGAADASTDVVIIRNDGSDGVDSTVQDGQADAKTADHQASPDVMTVKDAGVDALDDAEIPDAAIDAAVDSALPTACVGSTAGVCPGGTLCVNNVCTVAGQAAGQACGTGGACPSGTTCGSTSYCTSCGGPGEPCCDVGTACGSGGCCVANICTPSGSVCPYSNGGLCENSSCGNACSDGGCGVCGGPGQSCCAVGCTASQVQCKEPSDAGKVCESCGGPGQACCAGNSCGDDTLVCDATSVTCALCGGEGEPCCTSGSAGSCSGSLACSSNRCQ
jgi:hypothetical protein